MNNKQEFIEARQDAIRALRSIVNSQIDNDIRVRAASLLLSFPSELFEDETEQNDS